MATKAGVRTGKGEIRPRQDFVPGLGPIPCIAPMTT